MRITGIFEHQEKEADVGLLDELVQTSDEVEKAKIEAQRQAQAEAEEAEKRQYDEVVAYVNGIAWPHLTEQMKEAAAAGQRWCHFKYQDKAVGEGLTVREQLLYSEIVSRLNREGFAFKDRRHNNALETFVDGVRLSRPEYSRWLEITW